MGEELGEIDYDMKFLFDSVAVLVRLPGFGLGEHFWRLSVVFFYAICINRHLFVNISV